MANNTELSLLASGITALSPIKDCKDGQCPLFSNGTYFKLPTYQYGQVPGLTVSMWIKPSNTSGANARIFEMSDSTKTSIMAMYREGWSSKLGFSVTRGGKSTTFVTEDDKSWDDSGVWKHVTWAMGPKAGSLGQPAWTIYIDGSLIATLDGPYLEAVDLDSSYIGRAASGSEGQYFGYIDSFVVMPLDLSAGEVQLLFLVSKLIFCSLVTRRMNSIMGRRYFSHHWITGRHDWFYYTSTKCAIPDDMTGLQKVLTYDMDLALYTFSNCVKSDKI
jgi:hypothetical protein